MKRYIVTFGSCRTVFYARHLAEQYCRALGLNNTEYKTDYDDEFDMEPVRNECPYCNRIMSQREANEQRCCNDCNGSYQ